MAAVLGWGRGAVRGCVDRWLRGGLALSVGLLLAVGTAQAQVDVSVKQSGSSVPQTPSGNVMSVLVPITIGVVAVGAAAVALPATGALAISGDVVAAAGMSMIRSRVIQGAALMTLIGTLGGDVSLDGNGNVVAPAISANAGDTGFNGWGWTYGYNTSASGGNIAYGVAASPGAACSAMLAADAYLAGQKAKFAGMKATGNGTSYECHYTNDGGDNFYAGVGQAGSCISGYVASGGSCVPDPAGPSQPATDGQIQNAIKAHPSSWQQVYNDGGCTAQANILVSFSPGQSNQCLSMIGDSSTGFGVSFPSGNTVASAPKTDTQTKTNADGSKTTKSTTTTTTTTVNGTNDRTNPVTSQTTTTTSTSTTTTNPDGSTTTTTETTTDQAPSQSATNANQQQQDKQQPTTATFSGASQALYTKKDKTYQQVLQGFVNRVQAMPWYTATVGFFNVSISGGSCPHWAVPATRWNPALDMNPYVCSSTMTALYAMGGYVVLAVAAWAAFRIAFL